MLPFPAGRRERESRSRRPRRSTDDRAEILQAPRPHADGEDGRELHGGAPAAAAAAAASRSSRSRSPPPRRRSASAPGAAGRSGSSCSTRRARPRGRIARSRAGSPSAGHRTRWPGTCRRSSAATRRRAAGCARSASTTTASPSPPRRRSRSRSSASTTAFVDPGERERWLPDGDLRERTATEPSSARFDWGDGATRVHVTFAAKGEAKSMAALSHERLPDAGEAERMKAYWRERVAGAEGGAGGMSAVTHVGTVHRPRRRPGRGARVLHRHARLRGPHGRRVRAGPALARGRAARRATTSIALVPGERASR